MSLNLISKFKELEKVGIIKNFKVVNCELRFELDIPKEKVLKMLDSYLFTKYSLIFE